MRLRFKHNNLGVTYEKMNRFEDAVREYRLELRIKPDFKTAYDNLKRIQANHR
jgi:tetratricopeptide (TPR) repeat protein